MRNYSSNASPFSGVIYNAPGQAAYQGYLQTPYPASPASRWVVPHQSEIGFFRRMLRFLFGALIVGVALLATISDGPDKYLPNANIPPEVIGPRPLSDLWGGALHEDRVENNNPAPRAHSHSHSHNRPAETAPAAPPPVLIDPAKKEREFMPVQQSKPLHLAEPGKAQGAYIVQLVAAASRNEAQLFYEDSKSRNSDLLYNLKSKIEPVYRRDGQTFYRLYVFPFGHYNQAQDFCYQLKSRNEDCFVRKTKSRR